jgi:hypothetical protein
VKQFTGLLPFAFIHQLIQVGYAVFQWAACAMAKRYPTIHAPCGLLVDLLRCKRQVKLGKIMYSFLNWPMYDILAFIF